MKLVARIAACAIALLGASTFARASAELFSAQCAACHNGVAHPMELVYNAAGNAAIIERVNSLGMGAAGSVADHASIATYLDTTKPTITRAQVAHNSPGTTISLRDIKVSGATTNASLKIIERIETVTAPTKGTVRYRFGLGFSAPSQVIYTPFPGQSGVDTWTYKGVATQANAGLDTTVRTASVDIAPSTSAPNYTALWWKSPANSESGWGLNIVHQGTTLFATWFTYDTDGTDLWLFMDNLQPTGPNSFAGDVYRAVGSPFGVEPYDNSRFVATQVGTASLSFSDPNNGNFTFTVNGLAQSKSITKFTYGSPVPTCTSGTPSGGSVNYQDLWWRSPARSENGVGYNIIHQGDVLFVTWFTYDTDGSQMWLFMDNAAKQSDGSYAGNIYQARGSPVASVPYDPSRFQPTQVGTGTIRFSDAGTGTFSYTAKGVTQSKPITRFVFSSPVPVCQ